jgi:hypothetical protein
MREQLKTMRASVIAHRRTEEKKQRDGGNPASIAATGVSNQIQCDARAA